jgi:hypothetical protein
MKKLAFLFLMGGLLFFACKDDKPAANGTETEENKPANPLDLSGHWFAMDFCSRAGQYGSVLGAMNNSHMPYAYAMFFDVENPDSVRCYNGEESWTLPVSYNVDTLELKGAKDGKSVFLMYDSQGERGMTMFDGTSGRTRTTAFMKSKANAANAYMAFATALNHNLLGGMFVQAGGGRDTIQFTPGGFITNFGPFDRYQICTTGDCFVTGSEIDVITMGNSKEPEKRTQFGFRYNTQMDELSLHRLTPNPSNDKAVYTVGPVAYTFKRIKSN